MVSHDLKVTYFVAIFHCLLSAAVCSILVLLQARSSIAQRSNGWVEFGGLLFLAKNFKPLFEDANKILKLKE